MDLTLIVILLSVTQSSTIKYSIISRGTIGTVQNYLDKGLNLNFAKSEAI